MTCEILGKNRQPTWETIRFILLDFKIASQSLYQLDQIGQKTQSYSEYIPGAYISADESDWDDIEMPHLIVLPDVITYSVSFESTNRTL